MEGGVSDKPTLEFVKEPTELTVSSQVNEDRRGNTNYKYQE